MMYIFLRLNVWLLFCTGNPSYSHSPEVEKMESEILQYVNEDRIKHDLPVLEMNTLESSLAAEHSRDMATGKVRFGHDGFTTRAKTIQKVLGSTTIGENVASGPMTARQVVDGWLHSAGHRKNIEGDFILTGIGYSKNNKGEIYFTQIFSR